MGMRELWDAFLTKMERRMTYYKRPFGERRLGFDYVVGRMNGYYAPNPIPNFINKLKPGLVLSPPKLTDVFKEEMCRETARQAFRKGQMKIPF
jgi:hypothetical protein